MLFEHLIYSAAFALLIGLGARRFQLRDYSWIILLFALAPDLDALILEQVQPSTILIFGSLHTALHSLGALAAFSLIAALLLYFFGMPFFYGLGYTALAYGLHLFEDALAYAHDYPLLWPLRIEPSDPESSITAHPRNHVHHEKDTEKESFTFSSNRSPSLYRQPPPVSRLSPELGIREG